jgi:hypothetical protein
VQYVVIPFTFNTVRRRLKRYQEYHTLLTEHELILAQQEIDHLLNTLRDADPGSLSRDISPESLRAVVSALTEKAAGTGMSAVEWRARRVPHASRQGATSSTSSIPGSRSAAPATEAPADPKWYTGWRRARRRAIHQHDQLPTAGSAEALVVLRCQQHDPRPRHQPRPAPNSTGSTLQAGSITPTQHQRGSNRRHPAPPTVSRVTTRDTRSSTGHSSRGLYAWVTRSSTSPILGAPPRKRLSMPYDAD